MNNLVESLQNLNVCPCGSEKSYAQCCKRCHEGNPAESALELMRSRYSAYALGLIDYILETTHPLHADALLDPALRKKELLAFCKNTRFEKLQILESVEKGNKASVTFIATLSQNGRDASFKEKSLFEKLDGRWLYLSGSTSPLPKAT